MKNKISFYLALMIIPVMAIMSSCKEEEIPDPTNEEELITTLQLTFENDVTGEIDTFSFRDLDGPGGASPVQFDTIRLAAGTMYHVYAYLLNESVSPSEDIGVEVEEEGADHQMFYTVAGADISFTYEDADTNGNPIGLHMMATTGAASGGTVTVTLKHQPGIKDGNIATGETDVEVAFETEIN